MRTFRTGEDHPIFIALSPLYLASASPRRIAFLHELGLTFQTLVPPETAEPGPLPSESAQAYVLRAAQAKARAALPLLPADATAGHGIILAADTIVVLNGRILGKPQDADHALVMLRQLAGNTHHVLTACVLHPPLATTPAACFSVSSEVSMWDCPEDALKAYAHCGEPLDKAGAYAVQGRGAFLVRSLTGSWSNVVGLPLTEVTQALLAAGCIAPRKTPL